MDTKQIKVPKTPYINAQEMASHNPDTFAVPPLEDLRVMLETGCFVKVSTGGERFWVELTSIDGDVLYGRLDNDLTRTGTHGLECDDLVGFRMENVYVMQGPNVGTN